MLANAVRRVGSIEYPMRRAFTIITMCSQYNLSSVAIASNFRARASRRLGATRLARTRTVGLWILEAGAEIVERRDFELAAGLGEAGHSAADGALSPSSKAEQVDGAHLLEPTLSVGALSHVGLSIQALVEGAGARSFLARTEPRSALRRSTARGRSVRRRASKHPKGRGRGRGANLAAERRAT